jgi:hypothetical protein
MKTILVDINSMQKTNDTFHLNENKRLSKSMVKNIINSGNFHNGYFVSTISTGKLAIDPKRFYSVTTSSTKLNFESNKIKEKLSIATVKPFNSFNTLPYTVVNSVRYYGFSRSMGKLYGLKRII